MLCVLGPVTIEIHYNLEVYGDNTAQMYVYQECADIDADTHSLLLKSNPTIKAYFNSDVTNFAQATDFCASQNPTSHLALINNFEDVKSVAAKLYQYNCPGKYLFTNLYDYLGDRKFVQNSPYNSHVFKIFRNTDAVSDGFSSSKFSDTTATENDFANVLDVTGLVTNTDLDGYLPAPILCQERQDTDKTIVQVVEDCCCLIANGQTTGTCVNYFYHTKPTSWSSSNSFKEVTKDTCQNEPNPTTLCYPDQYFWHGSNAVPKMGTSYSVLYFSVFKATDSLGVPIYAEETDLDGFQLIAYEQEFDYSDPNNAKDLGDAIVDQHNHYTTWTQRGVLLDLKEYFDSKNTADGKKFYITICPSERKEEMSCRIQPRFEYQHQATREISTPDPSGSEGKLVFTGQKLLQLADFPSEEILAADQKEINSATDTEIHVREFASGNKNELMKFEFDSAYVYQVYLYPVLGLTFEGSITANSLDTYEMYVGDLDPTNKCTLVSAWSWDYENNVDPRPAVYNCNKYNNNILIKTTGDVLLRINEIVAFYKTTIPAEIKVSASENVYYKDEDIVVTVETKGNFESSGITWTCGDQALDTCFDATQIAADNSDPATGTKLVLDADKLSDGQFVTLKACVIDSGSSNQVCDEVEVSYRNAVKGALPEMKLTCINNCLYKYDFSKIGTFKLTCINCPNDSKFEIVNLPSTAVDYTESSGIFDKKYQIPANFFREGDTIQIVFRLTADSVPSTVSVPVESKYLITTNSKPAGGTCRLESAPEDVSYLHIEDFISSFDFTKKTTHESTAHSSISEFTPDLCHNAYCNDCIAYALVNANKTCEIFETYGISAKYKQRNLKEYIFQKTLKSVEPILGEINFICEGWSGSSSTLTYKANLILPAVNVDPGSTLQIKNERLNLVTSDTENMSGVSIPQISDLKTATIEFEICDAYNYCTRYPDNPLDNHFIIGITKPDDAAVAAKLDGLIDDLDGQIDDMSPAEIASLAAMTMSAGQVDASKKRKLANTVAKSIVKTGLKNMKPADMVGSIGTLELLADSMVGEDSTQESLQNNIGDSISSLAAAELTDEQKATTFNSINGIANSISKNAKPEDTALAEILAGKAESSEEREKQDKSMEELEREIKDQAKVLFKTIREKKTFTDNILKKSRSISNDLANEIKKNIVGEFGQVEMVNKDSTVAASVGAEEGQGLEFSELKLNGSIAEVPMNIAKSGNGLVVKKRDVNIKNVIDIKDTFIREGNRAEVL